jgi:CheY-specific phosphatase CheX
MSLQESLIEAVDHFARVTLNGEAKETATIRRKRAWTASVETIGEEKWLVFVHVSKPSLVKMAALFLNENAPNDEILRDLIGEIANLIVGRAKVTAAERGLTFSIAAPRFEGKAKAIAKNAEIKLYFALFDDTIGISARKVEK